MGEDMTFSTEQGDIDLEDLDDLSLPFIVRNATLASPGEWKGFRFTADNIERAEQLTDWDDRNRALFNEHSDADSRDWIGFVENIHTEQGELRGDVVIVSEEPARKVAAGAKFGISPRIQGNTRDGRELGDFRIVNFSLVWNPAIKTTFLNSEDAGKIRNLEQYKSFLFQDSEVHTPDFTGTTESEWDAPDLEDFDTDELSEIDDHFIMSMTGFPPENFTDLKLPVVEPNGDLNVNALANAKARLNQTKGLSSEARKRVAQIINRLAEDNFPDSDFEPIGEEKMSEDEQVQADASVEDQTETEESQDATAGVELDYDKLAGKVAEKLSADEGDADVAEDAGEEDSEADVSEDADADVSEPVEAAKAAGDVDVEEFSDFLTRKREENPEMSFSEIAEAYEESQKDASEQIEEVRKEFSERVDSYEQTINDLKAKLDDVQSGVDEIEPQKLSQRSAQSTQEVQEKFSEMSDEELNRRMYQYMSDIQGTGTIRGVQ